MRALRVVVELCAALALLVAGDAVRARVGRDWAFGGADSYAYLHLADELREHRRYALGPREPPHWFRPPLYPAFLAVVEGDAKDDPRWARTTRAQRHADVFVTGLLVWLVARRLGGAVAGLVALGLWALWPACVLSTAAMLTETLASALALAAIAPLLLWRKRPRVAFAVAGALLGLGALVRQDGVVFGAAFVPALFLVEGWRDRLRCALLALVAFVVVWGAWPLRNLARFGTPHIADGHVDRYTRPLPYYRGYWRWLRTWAKDWRPTAYDQVCFFTPGCPLDANRLAALGAFVDAPPGERAAVEKLLALRARAGVTREVDDGFAAVAAHRRAARPVDAYLRLPWKRAWGMWTDGWSELLQNPAWRPWPDETKRVMPKLGKYAHRLAEATGLAAIVLLAWARTRRRAAVLVAPLVVRTALLGFTAYCLPRYVEEMLPLAFVLVGFAVGAPLVAAGERLTRRPPAT